MTCVITALTGRVGTVVVCAATGHAPAAITNIVAIMSLFMFVLSFLLGFEFHFRTM
jgi:hypothetical protein